MTAIADWLLFASMLLINLGSAMVHWARGRWPGGRGRRLRPRPLLFGPYLVLFYVSVIALWAFTWPLGVWAWLPTAASYVLHIAALIDAQARGHG